MILNTIKDFSPQLHVEFVEKLKNEACQMARIWIKKYNLFTILKNHNYMQKLLFLLLVLFSNILVKAQITCGTDEILKLNPQIKEQLLKLENNYKNNKKARIAADIIPNNTTIYTIPLVFHIYHLGEAIGTGSNVSDATIIATVNRLNAIFGASGIHAGKTTDVKIQFVLASFTEACQPTNGIVRIDGQTIPNYQTNGVSYADGTMHQALRTASNWDENQFINIRICHSITDAGGFAYFLNDVFMPASSMTIETNVPWIDAFWAHEMGHSMNLYHTFEGDGDNMNCPANTNPEEEGDRVSDTDPHKRDDGCDYSAINSCTGNAFGVILKNIMSYSCKELFSPKQVERMRYALVNYRPGYIVSKGITGVTASPSAAAVTICSPGSATLQATGCTGTYNWYATATGGSSLGTAAIFTTPSINSNTNYFVSCTEPICGTSGRTQVEVFLDSVTNPSVCNVVATNGLSIYFGISSFILGTINYTGTTTSNLGTNYQNNTCTKLDLQAGTSYPFTLLSTYGNTLYGKIFIDYNNDGDFNDTDETAYDSNSWKSTHTGNIMPLSTAITNTYLRMRVMLDWVNMTACTLPGDPEYKSGLAVDFSLKILPQICNVTAPTAVSNFRCDPGTVALSATGCTDGTYKWYNQSSEGTLLSSLASYTTNSISATTNYYVDCTVGSCTSARTLVIATINTVPDIPTIAPVVISSGQMATLNAVNCTGGIVKWYNASTGGDLLFTGASYTSPALTINTNYFASCTQTNCESSSRGLGAVSLNCIMQTIKSGNWNDPTVWSCNRIPIATDAVIISSGNIIIVPNGIFQVKNITMAGTINYNVGGVIRLNQ